MPVPQRLLSAATELFARKGFEETSVREITARAHANLGAITYHFGSKEALYHAAIESVVEPLVDAISAGVQRPGNALDRIDGLIRAFLAHVAAHPGAPELLLRELSGDRPLPPPIKSAMKRNLATLTRTILEGQQEGSIRAGEPILLALSVVSQPFFFAVAGRLVREAFALDDRDPAVFSATADHIVASARKFLAAHQDSAP